MLSNKKALIVDDTKSVQLVLEEELKKEGFETDSVSAGEEAIKKLERKKYDLIFLDYNLPGMSGTEIYKRIHTKDPEAKIIMISGYVNDLLLGGREVPFIHKPFLPNEIMNAVRKLVEI